MIPQKPINGNAYGQSLEQLPLDMHTAISNFENDPIIARILPGLLIENFCLTKRQEVSTFETIPLDEHWKTSLEKV